MWSRKHVADASVPGAWRKSSYSGPSNGDCLEVRDGFPGGVPVRDSKAPHGPALLFSVRGWSGFVSALQHGTLNRPSR